MDAAGLSPADMARAADVSKPTVTFWLNGQTQSLKAGSAAALELATGYRANWLIMGKGPKLVREGTNVSSVPLGVNRIPLISYAQAGAWTEENDSFSAGDASEWLLTDLKPSTNTFALQIKGDSMLPDFKPGDRVIIDPAVAPLPGDFVVAKNGNNEATFKKYRPRGTDTSEKLVFELVPLNDDFPSIRSDVANVVIIGTMIEHRKYRKRG